MKIGTKLYRRLRLAAVILLVIVLVPYVFSRVASSWRCVSVHSIDESKTSHSEDSAIKIVCYNIAHGRGLATSNWSGGTVEQRTTRLDQIADLLQAIDADVVVLNEVDFDSSWSSSTNQARYLAQQAGYSYWAEQRNLDFRILAWKWRFGNAILSKYPITEASVVDLPGFSTIETLLAGKKRGLKCTVDVHGQNVRIVGVHLSHRSEAVRARSATLITEIAQLNTAPTIVAGDLNSSPAGFPDSQSDREAGNAIDILDASLLFQRRPEQPTGAAAELTYHSTQPTVMIDWILISKNCQFIDYYVKSAALSDHRPVVAELSLPITEDMPAAD